MSQVAHSEGWSHAGRTPRGGRRFRFEVARSQLLVLAAALALLAMLFFLSGLAIGLLMHPRWALPSPQAQTETREPVTAPRSPVRSPPQSTAWVSAGSPPSERTDLAVTDLTDIVWQPRRSREPWERTAEEAFASNPRTSVDPSSESSAIAADSIEPVAQVAQAAPLVDPVYQPRPGGLAQPPRRWRQAQPLAAAYLRAPEDASLPTATEPGPIPDADSDTSPATATDAEPQAAAGLTDEPSPDTDDESLSRWTASEDAHHPPSQPEDAGWRPASSHWQSFYDGLLPETSAEPSAAARTATTATTATMETPAGPQDVIPADDASSGTVDEAFLSSATPEADSWMGSTEASGQEADDERADDKKREDSGWQPSSSLWQSFFEDPYDWSAERLPTQTTRRSTAPRGSMQVPYGDLMDRAARRHGLDVALVAALVRVESDFDPQAVSHRGARGLMQVMPATAERFGVVADDLFDPAVNLDVGMQYLAWLEDRFEGDTERMLAAYNAGEAAVDTYDGVPPYGETQRYVKRIYRLMGWAETQ